MKASFRRVPAYFEEIVFSPPDLMDTFTGSAPCCPSNKNWRRGPELDLNPQFGQSGISKFPRILKENPG
jgi:hypothetical protein